MNTEESRFCYRWTMVNTFRRCQKTRYSFFSEQTKPGVHQGLILSDQVSWEENLVLPSLFGSFTLGMSATWC